MLAKKRLKVRLAFSVALCLCAMWTVGARAQSPRRAAVRETAEQRAARHFETLRARPPQMLAFLLRMPKGGDLHNHLSGAIYAESFISWAASKGLCVSQTTLALSQPPCDAGAGRPPSSAALTNPTLYRQMIDAWSMRYWQYSGQNGHDHFFDAFGKFGAATAGQTGAMLAEALSRAAKGRVSYLELMLTPDGGASSQIGQKVGWDGDPASTLKKLKEAGIEDAAARGAKALEDAEAEKDALLKCRTPQADPGCAVTVRYIFQVGRAAPVEQVYAQMVAGFTMADRTGSKVLALNLVQPEDSLNSMRNFTLHMRMLDFLRPLYPRAHISLHAGELAPGLVPPEGLSFHVRESVLTGHAERIGHGVSIMHEDEPFELLKELARRNVLIEICLTSNDVILGVSGKQHPLSTYMEYGVPLALATDDEGVSRSEISREYMRAAEEQGLTYTQLKQMARNSLEHAFLSGRSLWSDARSPTPVPQCARDLQSQLPPAGACAAFLAANEKAQLQFKLENEFRQFESRY